MTQVSIANLPAFVGTGFDPADLVAVVDTSDTTESPLGTTKRGTFAQLANFGGDIVVKGDVTATPNLIVTGTDAQSRGLAFQTLGKNRWYEWIGGAETGANAGGNFLLNAYADDGSTLIDSPMSITRVAGGTVAFSRPISFASIANKEVFHNVDTEYLRFAGGATAAAGGNIVVFGPTHPSVPNTVQINGSGGVGFSGQVSFSEPLGNNVVFTSSVGGVGPIVRWTRTSATARTWQLRLNTSGAFEFVDETGGALVMTLTQAPNSVLQMIGDAVLVGSAPNGRQIQIANSSVYASIGTGYSSGALRLASNAVAVVPGTDNWVQGYPAGTSALLEIDSASGLKFFKANAGAGGAYPTFWGSPVFTVSLGGTVAAADAQFGLSTGQHAVGINGGPAGSGNAFVFFGSAGVTKWLVGRGPADNSDNLQFYDQAGGRVAAQIVSGSSLVAIQTGLLLSWLGGGSQSVTVMGPNSGGAGFRTLVVPN